VYAVSAFADVDTDAVEDAVADAAGLGEEASAAEDVDTADGEMVLPSGGIR
jgi:regulator of RNase E activity RraB